MKQLPNIIRYAFTLVEVFVVLSILSILIALILPAIQKTRSTAEKSKCQNQLRQIGIALHLYHDQNGYLPPKPRTKPKVSDPEEILGWMVLILPQLEQSAVFESAFQACRIETDPLKNPPHVAMTHVIRMYRCSADSRLGTPKVDPFGVESSYVSYIGIRDVLHPDWARSKSGMLSYPGIPFSSVRDGLSNTFMVAERPPPDSLQAGWWYPSFIAHGQGRRGPNNTITYGPVIPFRDPCYVHIPFSPGRPDNPCDRFHLWSMHIGGANFLFADISVRFYSYSAVDLLYALATIDGGEVSE